MVTSKYSFYIVPLVFTKEIPKNTIKNEINEKFLVIIILNKDKRRYCYEDDFQMVWRERFHISRLY